MTELLKFIGDTPFEKIKDLVSPLKIQVKSTEDLYILNFTNDADFSDKRVRQANGMILEKNTNKLVHFSFEKCYEIQNENCLDPYLNLKEEKNLSFELFFEGSLIKLFYYKDTWNIATSKYILANKNFWTSKRAFDSLFKEAVESCFNTDYQTFEDSLEKNLCHTFLLQHPDNKMTLNISKEVVYHVNKVNLETLTEERPEKDNLTITKTLQEILDDNTQNYMIFKTNEDNSVTRIKKLTKNFIDTMQLRGSYPDIGLSYMLNLKHEELKDKYTLKFPQLYNKFLLIDKLIFKATRTIHTLYVKNYAEKLNLEIPENVSRTLKQLHGQYKKTKIRICQEDVYKKLINLEPKILAFVIGYKY